MKKIFINNNGIVQIGDIISKGFTIRHLNKLIDKGAVYRIKRGVYQWVDEDVAQSVLAKLRNKAKLTGKIPQLVLQLFYQEEFLRKVYLYSSTTNY